MHREALGCASFFSMHFSCVLKNSHLLIYKLDNALGYVFLSLKYMKSTQGSKLSAKKIMSHFCCFLCVFKHRKTGKPWLDFLIFLNYYLILKEINSFLLPSQELTRDLLMNRAHYFPVFFSIQFLCNIYSLAILCFCYFSFILSHSTRVTCMSYFIVFLWCTTIYHIQYYSLQLIFYILISTSYSLVNE